MDVLGDKLYLIFLSRMNEDADTCPWLEVSPLLQQQQRTMTYLEVCNITT